MMKLKMIKKISIKTKLGWVSAFENRGKIFKRESSRSIQNNLTMHHKKNSDYQFNINIKKSEVLNYILPDKYIFFHFNKKRFDDLDWKFNELQFLLVEFSIT